MSKITLSTLANLANQATSLTTINNNSTIVQNAFDNTLSRDGTAPNQMAALLDMNSNRIINLPAPLANTDAARLVDLTSFIIGSLPAGQIVFFTTQALAAAFSFPPSAQFAFISGYSAQNDGGGGLYFKMTAPPSPSRRWNFKSADGAWWQLATTAINPKQVGAAINGTTDDTVALQAWADYPTYFGGISVDWPGTALVAGTIELLAGTHIEGSNVLTLLRNSNAETSIMECGTETSGTNSGPIIVRGINFSTNSGFTATSSSLNIATIGGTTVSLTVAPGLDITTNANPALADWVEVKASGSVSTLVNYFIGSCVSYVGTTLMVAIPSTDAVGSGSYTTWDVDKYPLQDSAVPFSNGNTALRFRHANNITVERVNTLGHFYYAIDFRNCSQVNVNQCNVTSAVNRSIAAQAYNNYGMSDISIRNCFIDGASFNTYGINISATAGASLQRLQIQNNRIINCLFDGIVIGGNVNYGTVNGNVIMLLLGSATSNCITAELIASDSSGGPYITQHLDISNNSTYGGQAGIYATNCLYVTINSNDIQQATYGIYVTGNGTNVAAYHTISSNILSGISTNAILLNSSGTNGVQGQSITGNICVGTLAAGSTGILASGSTANLIGVGNYVTNFTTAYNITWTAPTSGNI